MLYVMKQATAQAAEFRRSAGMSPFITSLWHSLMYFFVLDHSYGFSLSPSANSNKGVDESAEVLESTRVRASSEADAASSSEGGEATFSPWGGGRSAISSAQLGFQGAGWLRPGEKGGKGKVEKRRNK